MNKRIKFSVGLILSIVTLCGIFAVSNPTPVYAMTCDSATITGYVITNGNNTDARFVYGTNYSTVSAGNGTYTTIQNVEANRDRNIDQLITGLSASTQYFYGLQIKKTSNQNWTTVDIQNFPTPACGGGNPSNPTFVNFDFIVKNSCDNSAIPNATVTIDQDFGNGTSRTTDGSGFANLGVHSNTNLRWTASKSGYSSDSGTTNSGTSTTTTRATLTPNGGCSQPPTTSPKGYLDGASCTAVNGWAIDFANQNSPISVLIYDNGRQIASGISNMYRSDVGSAYPSAGPNHAFVIPVSFNDADSHTITASGVAQNGNFSLNGTKIVSGCQTPPPPQNTPPKGYLDTASCSEITGWAFGQNYSTVSVELSDGRNTVSVLANMNRQDVGIAYPAAGAWHGFSLATPSVFKDTSPHTIYATAGGTPLGTSPKTIPACQTTPPPPPPPQTCQDPTATNYRTGFPCTYPPQTCQDPTATNYRGSLPCTYPPQTCQDPVATNYRTGFPCTYPTPTCQDPNALNYRGTLPCQYPQQLCQDPNANNYRGTLPCTYPGPTCQDPNALNYRGTLPCTYPAQTCQDPNANNYRSVGTCTYTQRCQDTTATNYGSVGSCIYNNIQRCQDTRATNYGATGSCIYNQPIQTCQDPNAINYRGYLPCNYRPTILTTPRPTVVIFSDQTSIPFNGTGTIRWITTNATSCFASGGSVGWAGTKSIGPGSFYTGSLTASRTYTITCSNSFGSATDSVTLNVRGQIITTNTVRPVASSYVVISSSIDRNQPIVPTLDNTRPHPGDEINYTVTYQNIGNASITNLTLRLDLPYEVNYLSSNPNNPTITGNTLIFNLGTLRANGQGTVTARVRVRENIPFGTPLNFPAVLSYTDPSGNPQTVTANVSAQVWSEPMPVNENLDAPLGASVFGSGIFFPNSLLGWLLLLILILVLILLAKYFYDQTSSPQRPIEH